MISSVYRVVKKTETEPKRKKKAGLECRLAVQMLWGLSRGYFMTPDLDFGLGVGEVCRPEAW